MGRGAVCAPLAASVPALKVLATLSSANLKKRETGSILPGAVA